MSRTEELPRFPVFQGHSKALLREVTDKIDHGNILDYSGRIEKISDAIKAGDESMLLDCAQMCPEISLLIYLARNELMPSESLMLAMMKEAIQSISEIPGCLLTWKIALDYTYRDKDSAEPLFVTVFDEMERTGASERETYANRLLIGFIPHRYQISYFVDMALDAINENWRTLRSDRIIQFLHLNIARQANLLKVAGISSGWFANLINKHRVDLRFAINFYEARKQNKSLYSTLTGLKPECLTGNVLKAVIIHEWLSLIVRHASLLSNDEILENTNSIDDLFYIYPNLTNTQKEDLPMLAPAHFKIKEPAYSLGLVMKDMGKRDSVMLDYGIAVMRFYGVKACSDVANSLPEINTVIKVFGEQEVSPYINIATVEARRIFANDLGM